MDLSSLISRYEKEYLDALKNNTEIVKESLSEATLYEQLAEEASELSQACLKKARVIRGENPTPVNDETASMMVSEELTDIYVVSQVLGIKVNGELFWSKMHRWAERINESKA